MPRRSFDLVAPVYDRLARLVFGRSLLQAQAWGLSHLPDRADVLLLGGGTGWLLEQVLTHSQPRYVLYVEASERMLQIARERVAGHPKASVVDFRKGTQNDLTPAETFDAIQIPFVLDLFTEKTLAETLLPPLKNALRPGGRLLITDFVTPPVLRQKMLLWLIYRFFGLTAGIEARSLPDWPGVLRKSGFRERQSAEFCNGFVRSGVWY